MIEKRNPIIVSTGNIPYDYQILGPVYFQVSNKMVLFGESQYVKLEKKYKDFLAKQKGNLGNTTIGEVAGNVIMALFFGEFAQHTTAFERAFYMSVEELKIRTKAIGGDGIIFLRQDIDLDTNAFQFFYLQMYGTAVKILGPRKEYDVPSS